ncbi:hypothetical protein AKO1_007364 [Acrasis kona]|uniref:Uncharacterized protein n=1 Tax=Acrasis kona TaxID=1008807 RepID=A0AAW2YSM8_9EUKA
MTEPEVMNEAPAEAPTVDNEPSLDLDFVTDNQANTTWKSTLGTAFSCFFVVIATVLGTGILALPVKVGETGFGPFVTNFFICFVAQAFILIYMVELLQKTFALQSTSLDLEQQIPEEPDAPLHGLPHSNITAEKNANTDTNEDTLNSSVEDQEMEEIELEDPKDKKKTSTKVSVKLSSPRTANKFLSQGPDLHTMGKFFLNKYARVIFEASVILHFISILISYSIAGPSSYAKIVETLYNINSSGDSYDSIARRIFVFFIAPFIILWALVVIFANGPITKIISIATFIKGSLLVTMVVMTGFISAKVKQGFTDNWQYIGRPFLIGTVALGGAMNTLPIIYSKMRPTRRNLQFFRWSAVLALFVCFLLNVLWCFFVLEIVPQRSDNPEDPTLERAHRDEEISIVPVIEIINKRFPSFTWLGIFVQVFISISITVSFITMSTGMKHMLDGYVKSFASAQNNPVSVVSRITKWLISKSRVLWFLKEEQTAERRVTLLFQFLLYFIFFALILIFAQVNYKGFLSVMEIFTSMALNLESGLFVAFMLWQSRRPRFNNEELKMMMVLPLPNWAVHTLWIVGAYFLFAVIYDIVYTILRLTITNLPF